MRRLWAACVGTALPNQPNGNSIVCRKINTEFILLFLKTYSRRSGRQPRPLGKSNPPRPKIPRLDPDFSEPWRTDKTPLTIGAAPEGSICQSGVSPLSVRARRQAGGKRRSGYFPGLSLKYRTQFRKSGRRSGLFFAEYSLPDEFGPAPQGVGPLVVHLIAGIDPGDR